SLLSSPSPRRRSTKNPPIIIPTSPSPLGFSLHRAPLLSSVTGRPMELFQDGHHVRLRSRERGTYLHADDDGLGVSLSRLRASMNSAWAVHIYQGEGNAQYVLLHSAAYGRYLGATDAPAPRGHSGRRVEQCDYEPWEEVAIRWQAVRTGSGDDILLRQVTGRLRANGRYLSVDAFNGA
uniref:DUF569 domain-containing protein n=1 Tax=Aegilops tauschii subsp. strangulata TaxID=200361 RepID=A0A453QRM3_AEGTS